MSNVKSSKRILTSETVVRIGDEVLLKGWVKTRRDHGKLIFFDLRDRSGLVQAVVNQAIAERAYKAAQEIRPEFVVEILGKVNKRPEGTINKNLPTGELEVEVREIKILSTAESLPFDIGGEKLNLELPTLLDWRSLTLRHPRQQAIFKIQSAIIEGFRKAAQKYDCIELAVPTVVASATEGGAELFSVDYYGHRAYLAQSPQLYKQIMVSIFERVFTIAHAYRAEPSMTTRHLSETVQLDCETGFTNFPELLTMFEEVAIEMCKHAEERHKEIFDKYNLPPVAYGKIPRLRLREAQEIIYSEFGRDTREEKDLAPQDEVDLCKWAKEKHGSDFVTITHFPTDAKPFYIMPDPNDSQYSLSYDLLFRGVEIMSGGQRIHDYQQLVDSIKSRGMDPHRFEIYLMAFRYGMPPEGGFSFGLERITMKLMGLLNVREASLFPRDMERVDERFAVLEKRNPHKS